MAKLYFQKDDEMCHSLEYHIGYMKDNDIKEMEVFEAKREVGSDYFFCTELDEVGEVGQGCGKFCYHYKPRNGKNGRCKHSGSVFEQTEKTKILKLTT